MATTALRRASWMAATGAAIASAAIGGAPAPSPQPPITEPIFEHVFSEVPSDRIGYRRYVGTSKRFSMTGTLLGVYDESDKQHIPKGAIGVIALRHTRFYFGEDFSFTMKPGTSVFYAPATMKLPVELLK
jgi:hypothetical protein